MRHALGLAVLLLAAACSTAELDAAASAAGADFAAGCRDWQSVAALAGEAGALLPSPFNQAAAVTQAFVGDACTSQQFIAAAGTEQVQWIQQSTANLRAVVAAAQPAAQRTAELARLPSYGELRRP